MISEADVPKGLHCKDSFEKRRLDCRTTGTGEGAA